MQRRDFLRRIGLTAAGAVVIDRLELLERLSWKRSLFPGATFQRGVLAINNVKVFVKET